MKKALPYCIAAMMAAMATAGCTTSDDGDNYLFASEMLRINGNSSLYITSNVATLHIEANCEWRIEGLPEWAAADKTSGNGTTAVNITCEDNGSATTSRTASLTVKVASGKISCPVVITQAPGVLRFNLSTNVLSFSPDGGTMALGIDTNVDWQIDGSADWFTLDRTSGTSNDRSVNITCLPSMLEMKREATLLVKAGVMTQSVIVSQRGITKILTVTPTTIEASAIGAIYTINVSGDATWTASSTTPWAKLDKFSGIGDATILLTLDDNTTLDAREAAITFYTGSGEYTCTVKQAAGRLPVLSGINITDVSKHTVSAVSSFTSEFPVTEFGFCYSSTNAAPGIDDSKLQVVDHSGGVYSADITSLQSGRTYYIRAYAVSAVGTGYSNVVEVTTSGQIPDANDNPIPN